MCVGTGRGGVLQVKVGHWALLTLKREIFQLPNLPLPLPTLWQRTGACKEAANAEEISLHRHMAPCHTQTQDTTLLCDQTGG